MRRRVLLNRRLRLILTWLPCLGCAVAWPLSYRWDVGASASRCWVNVTRGAVYVVTGSSWAEARRVWAGEAVEGIEFLFNTTADLRKPLRILTNPPYPGGLAVVPLWALTMALAIPASWATWRLVPRRSSRLCPACGYDLRATPDRCPECGTAPPRPAPPPSA